MCVCLSSNESLLSSFSDSSPSMVSSSPAPSSSSSSSSSMSDVCLLAPDAGPCSQNLDRWYYSTTSRACALFAYGGCAGNGNNFVTKDACLRQCSSPNIDCPQVMCQEQCQVVADQSGCHTCRCPSDCQVSMQNIKMVYNQSRTRTSLQRILSGLQYSET